MATRVVLIPGMGADHRLYGGLEFPGFETLRTDWIPHRQDEGLAEYADRFGDQHGLRSTDVLIGVSMGGIVAGTLAQRLAPQRVILISSCTHIRQLSPWISALSPVGPFLPFAAARRFPRGWVPARRQLALTMFNEQDMAFVRWACRVLMAWAGAPRQPWTVSIHGTADRVFPYRRQPQVDVTIPGGGHLMVLDRATEIRDAIQGILAVEGP